MNGFFTLRSRADRQLAFGASFLLLALLAGVGFAILLDSIRPSEETQRFALRGEATLHLQAAQKAEPAPSVAATLTTGQKRDEPPAQVVIIIDDLGMTPTALEKLISLPPPLTLSFLPYAPGLQQQVDRALGLNHEIMLHLPMEARQEKGLDETRVGPGPNALTTSISDKTLNERLAKNLNSFTGYKGVNNHMGSRFTQSSEKMKTILSELDERGIFFLDSVTSGATKVRQAANAVGVKTLRRDVFLDADFGEGGAAYVSSQLKELEAIAKRRGYAVAIGHPYPTTLEALGPWLVTAEARGFVVVGASSLMAPRPALQTEMQVGH